MVTRRWLLVSVVLCVSVGSCAAGSQCALLTAERKFLSKDGASDREAPAVLWTTPGAGNTWVRQLIEYATGVHTGSMYNDASIESQMPGESRCDRSVVVVKGHPEHRTFEMVFNASLRDPCENSAYTTRAICLKQFAKYVSSCGGRPDFFRRAVAVVRDPFKTLLAEYQRFTKQESDRMARVQEKRSGAHTSVMRDLDPKAFRDWALPAARRMIQDWKQYARLAKLGRERIHFVRYEDLMARNLRALADLVNFLTPTVSPPTRGRQPGVTRQQLQCAYEQASGGAFRRASVDKRQLENRAFLSTVQPDTNETTACALWRVFGALGSRLGYAPPGVCGTAEMEKVGGDILALADRARTAGLARPRSLAAPVDTRILLPACGPQRVSVRVKEHGTYVAVARLSCETTTTTLNQSSLAVGTTTTSSSTQRKTTTALMALQVIQTKSATPKSRQQAQSQQRRSFSSSGGAGGGSGGSSAQQQRVFVRKRLYEKRIEVPQTHEKDWKWRGFGSLMLNPGSFDVVVEGATKQEPVCRVSHVALIGSGNSSAEMTTTLSYSLVSEADANPLVWDCGEGETSKTNKRRSLAIDLLRKRAIRGAVVLTACTKELAAIALNWAIHLERSSIFNYAIGALDDETVTRLGATLGGPVFRVPTRESRHAASFFDVLLGVPELSVLYVDVRAVLVSSHVETMLASEGLLGMRCAPVSHCSTLLFMPRANTVEGISFRERLVEELSVLRPLPESRTSSSLAPIDKPVWPSLNAALNSIEFVTPWTHNGRDVVETVCGQQQQQEEEQQQPLSSSSYDPRRINEQGGEDDAALSQQQQQQRPLVVAQVLCPRPLQVFKRKAHSKRLKVFFENEYQTELGWALTPYARYVIDNAVKTKANGASATVLARDDFFSDLLAHVESLPKSAPRNQLKYSGGDYSAFLSAAVPALSVIVTAPRAASMQAQVEALGAAAVAAETAVELVFVLREKNDSLRRSSSFPYKPYNLWATLSVVLVRDESDYVPKSPWIARLSNDALLTTDFGYWFARFRLSVDASEPVRVVAPCVATVVNVLHGSSANNDKHFDRLDCAESHTVAGKLECQAWLADHIPFVQVNGVKRKYRADSSSSSKSASSSSSSDNNATGGLLAAAGQLAVRSLYSKIGAFASLASWKSSWLAKVTTTRSLKSCGDLMGRSSFDFSTGDDPPVFEMYSSSAASSTKDARVEILPSALMVVRHQETRPAAMPASVPRGRAKRFERLTPQKAIDDLDLFGSPDKALETLAAMNVFVFALETVGGLANRLRALSTYWAVSAKLGRPMIVSWPIDPECEAQPSSLFDLGDTVKLPFVNVTWPNQHSPGVSSTKLNKIIKPIETHAKDVATKKAMMPPRASPERGIVILAADSLQDGGSVVPPVSNSKKSGQQQETDSSSSAPPLERPVHLYARTQRHAVYSKYWSFFLGYSKLDVRAALIGLRPSDFVSSRVRSEYSRVVDAVGIHVRMQWNETESVKGLEDTADTELLDHFNRKDKDSLNAYFKRRSYCHMDNFREYLSEKLLKPAKKNNGGGGGAANQNGDDIKFFVACDVTGCLDQFDSGDRAGHVVRDLQHHRQLVEEDCFRDSRSSKCQQLAFVELHLLASCNSLLISRYSSFSDIASLLSRSFRPNDDMVFGPPRDMAVQTACGFLDEKNATRNASTTNPIAAATAAAVQRKTGFGLSPSSALVHEGNGHGHGHGRPTRAEIYRKQLFLIQAQRRKQQQQQHAAAYSILKNTPFGATINNPNDPLVN